ncbi:hypothetical protein G7Y79_00041g078050 [Physcia stellaris]|nr:hypothetical protein G7Y79_00041g078050 [Physcia stellaris]
MCNLFKSLFSVRRTTLNNVTSKHDNHQGYPAEPNERITREVLLRSERVAPNAPHIYRINPTTVVKTSEAVRMTEAASMRFVGEITSIPVPKVSDAFVEEESKNVCIVMEYINGRPLDQVWDSYNKTQKDQIVEKLKQYMAELRRIPGTFIGSVDGTHCNDQFFDQNPKSYGPFDSEKSFNDGLIRAIQARGLNTWTEMVVRFIQALPKHEIVFTHNDLAPRNILVREGNVVGILDWEFSGFYPQYWEYVKALYWPDWQSSWIKEKVVDRILQPYLLELAYLLHARELIW